MIIELETQWLIELVANYVSAVELLTNSLTTQFLEGRGHIFVTALPPS